MRLVLAALGLAFLGALCRSVKHPTHLGPVVAWAQQGPKHDIARMDLERQQGILDRLVKAEACNHCPEVSTGTHKRGHHCKLLPDVRILPAGTKNYDDKLLP